MKQVGYCVYVIECITPGYFYVGISQHMEGRFQSHVNGTGAKFTQAHGVRKLVHVEYVASENIAKRLEREYVSKMERMPNVIRVAGASKTQTI